MHRQREGPRRSADKLQNIRTPDAYRRHPRMRDSAQFEHPQFQFRFFRDDHVGRGGDHRRGPRRQAGDGLRVQFHRPLRLRRADARALHPPYPGGRSAIAARRQRREFRPGKNSRRHAAAGEIRRPQRTLGRDRHHRGGGLGRGGEDRRQAAASAAGRALQRRQGRDENVLLRRRRLVLPRPDHQGPAGRDAPPSRCRLHHGEDEGRRRAACRRRAARRGGQEHPAGGRRACGRCQLEIHPRRGPGLRQGAGAVPVALVRGAVRSARITRRSPRSPGTTRRRYRPARTCSRRRTWRTSSASAASSPSAAT